MGLLDDWVAWRQGNASSLRDATRAGTDATMTALRGGLLDDAGREALVNTPAAWLGVDPMTKARGLLEVAGDPHVADIAKRFGLTEAEVRGILDTEVKELKARDEYLPPSNGEQPLTDFPRYDVGAAKIGMYGDPNNAYVSVLRKFNPAELTPTEHPDMIRQHPTFQRYVDWFKAGHEAPPVDVYQSEKTGGYLTSNRRRAMTAAEAGVPAINGWFSPNNTETGVPLKYGDIMRAIEAARKP
jgi:hypothetical protein